MRARAVMISLILVPVVFFVWWNCSLGPFPLLKSVKGPEGSFTMAASVPVARTESGGAVLDGRFYLAGGLDAWGRTLTSFARYDASSDQWETLPDLPRPINHPGVAAADGKIYIVGGFGPLGLRPHGSMLARWDPLDTVYIFDPERMEWSEGPSMPQPRGAGGAVAAGGSIWYAGGIDQDRTVAAELFRYDLSSKKWEKMNSMSAPRDHLRVEAVNDKLYAISGREDDLRKNLPWVERYDIAEGRWERVADIPFARGGFGSAVWNGCIYTFGGESVWVCLDRIERYDPEQNRWETLGKLPEARHGIMAGVLNGKIHLISGGRHPRISVSGIHRVFLPREERK